MNGAAPSGQVAVILEPAETAAVAPLAFAAHGLTPREAAVATSLLRGHTNKEAAHELGITPFTVQQHLKAVFEKFAVHSRGELIAKLLGKPI